MPTVFLSYSRDDLPRIEQLETQLKAHSEISIWRDQDRIYGGQKWPKVLGEAIADQDVMLLVWSKQAAASHFVEFEWRTAMALGKTIVPCLLDNTPLPGPVGSLHPHTSTEVEEIRKAIQAATPADADQRTTVLAALSSIAASEPGAVVEQAKAVYGRDQRSAEGNTGSANPGSSGAATPIHTKPRGTEKPFVDRWQGQAAFIASIFTVVASVVGIVIAAPDLSRKVGLTLFGDEEQVLEQFLAGSVQDAATNQLLDRADVTLPEFGLTVTTNPSGYFEFHVRAPKQDMVSVSARREGYDPSEVHKQLLGDRKITILLKRQAP